MKTKKFGVHASHCCIVHGCKYGAKDCSVVNKKIPQLYLCGHCNDGSDDPYTNGDKMRIENLQAMTHAKFRVGDRVIHHSYGSGKILGNYHKRGQVYYWHIQYDDNTFGYNAENSLKLKSKESEYEKSF